MPGLTLLDNIGLSKERARLDNKVVRKRKVLEACIMSEAVSTNHVLPEEMKILHYRIKKQRSRHPLGHLVGQEGDKEIAIDR